ncbi:recombinase family protein [Amycolatopsis sp. NPDC089917]|uniref:recombinase family protein n=1 Tax=Amycolatopsis sp. NPDC089917 TaxID=3155187 RepID=UPI00341B34BB
MGARQRGQRTGYERFDIPIARDGGIADLLAEAKRPDRRFDVVICESMSRIARKMYENLSVERELERAEVQVFASNEPILQRRINQSVAEYEVLNMLELSWGGTCTHVREGYNIGKPPYGYRAKILRHPNPAKADKGITKTRLEPDGARAKTVALIAKWRYHEALGFDTIAERLNQDLDEHPPHSHPVGAGRGAWSKSSVADIMKNPKYTGYQVYNRRARRSRGARNRQNPPEMWVWSTEPVHEPLIPKWMFDEMTATRTQRRGSRDGARLKQDPRTKRTYLLRSRVTCDCGRRMMGTPRKSGVYYRCHPAGNNGGRPDKHEGHPPTVYIREDLIFDQVEAFFNERLFGTKRHALLVTDQDDSHTTKKQDTERQRRAVQKKIADAARKQDNLLRQAENADPDDPFTQGLRQRYNDVFNERKTLLDELSRIPDDADDPHQTGPAQLNLLAALPYLKANLRHAPADLLRRLLDLTQLTIKVHYQTDQATITATLPGDLDAITAIGDAASRQQCPGQTQCASCLCPR